MKAYGSQILAIATVIAVAACVGGGTIANAQYTYDNYYAPTPPQGPPSTSATQQITVDSFITHHVASTGVHDGVYDRIDKAINDNNKCYSLARSGATSCFSDQGVDDNDKCIWGCTKNGVWISRPTSGAMITATKKRYSPWLAQTLYPDRPNDNVVQISYFMIYNLSGIYGCIGGVCIDYPWSRTVSQSIDIYISCKGWYTAAGDLTLTAVISAPYMDPDHSVLEDTIGGIAFAGLIPSYVDSRIRASLSGFGSGTSGTSLGFQCNRLGVTSFSDGSAPALESVNFNFVQSRILVQTVMSQITVRVTQVRRLMLHDSSGGIIRYETEYPRLDFYVGYSKLSLTLPPMLENQTYFPTATAALSVPVPSSGQLVLIATMWDLSHYARDPMFVVFDKNSNWGSGSQTLDTPKIWFELDPRISRKPILMRAAGYEVTVQITPPPSTFTTATATFAAF